MIRRYKLKAGIQRSTRYGQLRDGSIPTSAGHTECLRLQDAVRRAALVAASGR